MSSGFPDAPWGSPSLSNPPGVVHEPKDFEAHTGVVASDPLGFIEQSPVQYTLGDDAQMADPSTYTTLTPNTATLFSIGGGELTPSP